MLTEKDLVKWMRLSPRENGGVGWRTSLVIPGLSLHSMSLRRSSDASPGLHPRMGSLTSGNWHEGPGERKQPSRVNECQEQNTMASRKDILLASEPSEEGTSEPDRGQSQGPAVGGAIPFGFLCGVWGFVYF